ncbi:MAG TPA: LCP family protein [Thermoanaerobaculia bacterium]|nr:LCP family protein [Thermoanaerobaculia bacterium]
MTFRRPPSEKAAPTKVQSAVELTLFTVFGISVIVALIGFFAVNSPSHREVPNSVAAGFAAGRVNVLLIGMTKVPPPDGDGTEMMTDSLTLLSLRPSSHEVAMMPIPPELWLRVGHFGMHRLASAQSIGESSGYPGEGPALAIDTIQSATGQPVHAFLRMDDEALKSVVDALGGVDVVVRHAFYERHTRRRFARGPIHVDGATALLFTSPHVNGRESGRFAREARQQQLLAAVITKLSRSSADVRARALAVPATSTTSATNLTRLQLDQLFGAFADGSIRYVSLKPFIDQVEVQSFSEKAGPAFTPHGGDFTRIRALAGSIFGAQAPTAAASMVAVR